MERPDFFQLKNGEKVKLPFTKKEISSINKIVRQSTTLSGKKASESYFKEKNLNDFSVIHFATHFFLRRNHLKSLVSYLVVLLNPLQMVPIN